jgi:hypothetical protein
MEGSKGSGVEVGSVGQRAEDATLNKSIARRFGGVKNLSIAKNQGDETASTDGSLVCSVFGRVGGRIREMEWRRGEVRRRRWRLGKVSGVERALKTLHGASGVPPHGSQSRGKHEANASMSRERL